jgi:hypothetical protein
MSGHIERMKVEHKELMVKVRALNGFIEYGDGDGGSGAFNGLNFLEQGRMKKQLGFMEEYSNVLASRIWFAVAEWQNEVESNV